MKKILNALTILLAIHFLLVMALVGWMWQKGWLSREKIAQVRQVLAPKSQGADLSTTQPAEADPSTQPTLELAKLLARQSGRTAGEQVEFIQQSFDAHMAQLERRQRELSALRDQVNAAQKKMAVDRAALEQDQSKLAAEQKQATRLFSDKGFQDSLALYNSMSSRQVKTIFLTLDDATVVQYLQAMQPRVASKILKEFKTPEEITRAQALLEKMRQSQASARQ